MHPIQLPDLSPDAIKALDDLYQNTRDARLRTRAQMILLAAEKRLVAADIAAIVRTDEQTVRRWLKRYMAEGTLSHWVACSMIVLDVLRRETSCIHIAYML